MVLASGVCSDFLHGRPTGHHTRMRTLLPRHAFGLGAPQAIIAPSRRSPRGSTDHYCVSLCHNLSGQVEVRLWVLGSQSLFSNFCRVFMLYCQHRTDNLTVDTVCQPRNVVTPSNVLVFSECSAFLFRFCLIFFASFTMVIERPASTSRSRTEHWCSALFAPEKNASQAHTESANVPASNTNHARQLLQAAIGRMSSSSQEWHLRGHPDPEQQTL